MTLLTNQLIVLFLTQIICLLLISYLIE